MNRIEIFRKLRKYMILMLLEMRLIEWVLYDHEFLGASSYGGLYD